MPRPREAVVPIEAVYIRSSATNEARARTIVQIKALLCHVQVARAMTRFGTDQSAGGVTVALSSCLVMNLAPLMTFRLFCRRYRTLGGLARPKLAGSAECTSRATLLCSDLVERDRPYRRSLAGLCLIAARRLRRPSTAAAFAVLVSAKRSSGKANLESRWTTKKQEPRM